MTSSDTSTTAAGSGQESGTTMTLNTRKPTGAVPWPFVLIEGGEKTGKSWAAAMLSASDKVGRVLWMDWGEGAADEYGAIPGARYEVIEHDGSWASRIGQIEAARAEAQRAREHGDRPMVLVIDSGSCEWEELKDWASARARTTSTNRAKLERDPNAEITVPMNCWNDAAARHHRLMTLLLTFPGIVVVTARGGEVALVENGKPVEGKKSYRVEGHKNLAYDASCVIRLSRTDKPYIVGARSVHLGVRPGIDDPKLLADDWTLERVIFDVLQCDPAKAHVRDLVTAPPEAMTPEQIRDEACNPLTDYERCRALWRMAKHLGYEGLTLMNESGDEEEVLAMLVRLGKERAPAPPAPPEPPATRPPRQPTAQAPAASADQPTPASVPGEDAQWVVSFLESVAEAQSAGALNGLQSRLGPAIAQRTIKPDTATDLSAKVAEKRRELQGVPA
jgi:hypothetical protein